MLESKLLANLNLLNQRAFQLIVFQEDDCFKSLLDLQQVYEVSKKLLERQTCFNKNTFQAYFDNLVILGFLRFLHLIITIEKPFLLNGALIQMVFLRV
jgi:hypothetical protein